MPIELKYPRKGLINIKNNDQYCFLWCHVRHINPIKTHPGRITRIDRDFANNLNYDGTEFPVQEKDLKKVNKIVFALMCLFMKINWSFQFIFQIKHLKAQ